MIERQTAAIWKKFEHPKKEEPCLPWRRAGFSKNRWSMSDLELPACLLG